MYFQRYCHLVFLIQVSGICIFNKVSIVCVDPTVVPVELQVDAAMAVEVVVVHECSVVFPVVLVAQPP